MANNEGTHCSKIIDGELFLLPKLHSYILIEKDYPILAKCKCCNEYVVIEDKYHVENEYTFLNEESAYNFRNDLIKKIQK